LIDIPGAVAAAGGDGGAQRVLQGASFEGGIDARLGHGTREVRGKARPLA
jgi:hypothetical protein